MGQCFVKSPKVYVQGSGLVRALPDIESREGLHSGLGGLTPLERLSQQVNGVGQSPFDCNTSETGQMAALALARTVL